MKSNRAFVRNPGNVFYSRATLVTVTSECRVKRVICKTWSWTLANNIDLDQTAQKRVIRVCTICLNYRKLRVKWNSYKSPFRTILPAYTQRQPTHQWCQCFDYNLEPNYVCWNGIYSWQQAQNKQITAVTFEPRHKTGSVDLPSNQFFSAHARSLSEAS